MRLALSRVGQGSRPVLLLHGFLGSGRNLASLARTWSLADPSRTFLLPDLTGHGVSPPLPPGAGLDTIARDVLDTAAAEGLTEPLVVVGHSMGGRVAMQMKLLQPERVGDVTLLDIAPGPIGDAGLEQDRTLRAFADVPATFAEREAARQALAAHGLDKAMVEWLLTNLVPNEEHGYRWRIDRAALQALRPRMNEVDLWPAVERFGTSMRCIRGERSPYVSDADIAHYQRAGCPVTTIRDSGHFVHVDQLKRLVEELVAHTP